MMNPFEEVRDMNERLDALLYTLTGTDVEYFEPKELVKLVKLAEEVVEASASLLDSLE